MTEPRACFIGEETNKTIWSVDDAWFEGGASEVNAIAAYEIGIARVNGRHTQKIVFGIGTEYELSWDEMQTKIEARQQHSQEIVLAGDWLYFRSLYQLCFQHKIKLVICNFEYLEKTFDRANRKNNAILIDIQYDQAPKDFSAQHYGIELIANLLDGFRSRADLFFVTGYSDTLQKKIEENKNDPKWWVLRTLPYVSKAQYEREITNLETELKCFFAYFTQGIQTSLNQFIEELWNPLIESHVNIFSHPSSLSDIPQDFFLKECFTPWTCDRIESFKAIYHYEMPQLYPKARGSRKLLIDILQKHLDYLKIKINIVNKKPETTNYVKLPVQPGMLFFINLFYFLHRLDENEEHTIDFEIDNSGLEGKATLRIPLDPEKNPQALKESVITGNRKTMEAFRSLLACKELLKFTSDSGKTLNLISDHLIDEASELVKTWKTNKLVSEHDRIYYQLIDYEFINHDLLLSWTYDLPNQKQDSF